MKKQIFLMAIPLFFLCGVSFCQAPSAGIYLPQSVTSYGQHVARLKIDSAILLPTGCGKPTTLQSSYQGQAMQMYDSCNNVMWTYNPKSSVMDWDSSGGGGGGGTQDLQGVTDLGNTTTNDIQFDDGTIDYAVIGVDAGTGYFRLRSSTNNNNLIINNSQLTADRSPSFPDISGTVLYGTGTTNYLTYFNGTNSVSSIAPQTNKNLRWNGSTYVWVDTLAATNIYNSDGTLTGNRYVTGGGYGLTISGLSYSQFSTSLYNNITAGSSTPLDTLLQLQMIKSTGAAKLQATNTFSKDSYVRVSLDSIELSTLNGDLYARNLVRSTSAYRTMLTYDTVSNKFNYETLPVSGSGEINTASNLGGGLANWDSKSGVDLRFNTFAAADFDLASNLLTIDGTKWATLSAISAAYQPLDADLTYLAGFTPTANVKTILNAADYSSIKTSLSLNNVDNTSDATKNSATATLTNKRVTARTGGTTSSATPTINTDNVDYYELTAQAAAITSFTTNLSGTPTTAQKLWIAITDNGTARAITWGASFSGSLLPTTTVISTRMDIGFIWNGSTWKCVAVQ